MEIEKKIHDILEGEVKALGYDLAQVRLKKVGSGLRLEITVDRDEAISLEDIVDVSEAINAVLDREDPLDAPYTVDISSLGAEKPVALERLPHYVGRYVNVHLSRGYKGFNSLEGTILSVEEDKVKLSYREKTVTKEIEIPLDAIDKVRLAIQF